MTHLILVRHGESVWHREDRYAGSSDIALTPKGYQDALALAIWADKANLDALWVSPLSRTRETAAPVVETTGLSPTFDERLRELSFGQGEGLTKGEMLQLFPEAFSAFQRDPVTHHLPGGEDPCEAVERVLACFREIQRSYPEGKVLVIMHSTLMRLALCQLLGLPLSVYRTIFPTVRNGALTEIFLRGEKAALLAFNAPLATTVG